ncbi:hypothetical protein BJ878DRAFT_555826 [Calycina marina]|uniref:Uncharacterized protein n=1 Tax=Calycina marina TaxID=1763456 RepID=A0A9P8CCT3_9HELO|nr:hypothetical protein BJ878DRAFT_555826 [Calycina marina]
MLNYPTKVYQFMLQFLSTIQLQLQLTTTIITANMAANNTKHNNTTSRYYKTARPSSTRTPGLHVTKREGNSRGSAKSQSPGLTSQFELSATPLVKNVFNPFATQAAKSGKVMSSEEIRGEKEKKQWEAEKERLQDQISVLNTKVKSHAADYDALLATATQQFTKIADLEKEKAIFRRNKREEDAATAKQIEKMKFELGPLKYQLDETTKENKTLRLELNNVKQQAENANTAARRLLKLKTDKEKEEWLEAIKHFEDPEGLVTEDSEGPENMGINVSEERTRRTELEEKKIKAIKWPGTDSAKEEEGTRSKMEDDARSNKKYDQDLQASRDRAEKMENLNKSLLAEIRKLRTKSTREPLFNSDTISPDTETQDNDVVTKKAKLDHKASQYEIKRLEQNLKALNADIRRMKEQAHTLGSNGATGGMDDDDKTTYFDGIIMELNDTVARLQSELYETIEEIQRLEDSAVEQGGQSAEQAEQRIAAAYNARFEAEVARVKLRIRDIEEMARLGAQQRQRGGESAAHAVKRIEAEYEARLAVEVARIEEQRTRDIEEAALLAAQLTQRPQPQHQGGRGALQVCYVDKITYKLHENPFLCWASTEVDAIWLLLRVLQLVRLMDYFFRHAPALPTTNGGPKMAIFHDEDSDSDDEEIHSDGFYGDDGEDGGDEEGEKKDDLPASLLPNPPTTAAKPRTPFLTPPPPLAPLIPNDLRIRTPCPPYNSAVNPLTNRIPNVRQTLSMLALHLVLYMYLLSAFVERSMWLSANSVSAVYVDYFTSKGGRTWGNYPFAREIEDIHPWFSRADIWLYERVWEPVVGILVGELPGEAWRMAG